MKRTCTTCGFSVTEVAKTEPMGLTHKYNNKGEMVGMKAMTFV